MKKIIFVRHAKSSWEFDVGDRDRPLNSRGVEDASIIASQLPKKQIKIDAIFSSPANRALSTCKIFLKQLKKPEDTAVISEELYDFGGESVLGFIKKIDNTYNTVLLFGHNYAFTSLVNILGDQIIDNLPTSGLVAIDFDITAWRYLKFGYTKIVLFPRDFKS